MHLRSNFSGRLVCAALLAVFALASHSQTVMTPAQALDYRRASDLRLSSDGSRLLYVINSYRWDWQSHLWLIDIPGGTARQLTPDNKAERAPEWSPDGKMMGFLSNRDGKTQVFTAHADGSEPTAVTSRKYGVSSYHWSPDGHSIAYLAKDDSAPPSDTGPQVTDRESDLSRLWLTDLVSGMTRSIDTMARRIDEFQWLNSSQILVMATDHPRVEEHNDAVYSIDVKDGTVTLVSRPPQPFRGLMVSPDGKQFAVRSTRAAGPDPRDLFVGTIGRDDLRDISAPPDRSVAEVKWHDQSSIWVRVVDGFRNRIWRLPRKGPPLPVDLPFSADSFDISRDGTLVFAGGDFNHLPELYLKAKNGTIRQLTPLQKDWTDIPLASTRVFQTKSFDGTSIESALMRPANARPGEKLPLVLLVHGGPSSNFFAHYSWDTGWAQLLAAHGYLVLLVNPRGSNGYSEDFMKANHGDLGGGDYRDLMAVLDSVIATGEADPNRLGIGGWSYGGEMSAWAITQTNRFKAAVAGAPVFDQQAEFETEDGPADDEWHFGTPWEHPEVFARNSPATYIGNAHTPTLILDGEEWAATGSVDTTLSLSSPISRNRSGSDIPMSSVCA
jgi:dipeptidyl aminopeptidase/acylaminoacyl peptidase